MKKVFLYAYDRQNLGDDLFVHTIAKRYPHVRFYMWSDRKNRETFGMLPNLKIVDPDSRFVHLLQKLRPSLVYRYRAWLEQRCDAVVYIGGSIFMEYPNWENICSWWEYEAKNRPLYVLGANFGPWHTEDYRRKMAEIFAHTRDVCFRDRYSRELFGDVPTVRRAPDILFAHPMPRAQVQQKQVFVSVINCAGRDESHGLAECDGQYVSNMAALLGSFLADGYRLVLSSFCRAEGDEEGIDKLLNAMGCREHPQISRLCYDGTNANELTQAMAQSQYVIATRFHGTILAMAAGRPVLPILYSDKTLHVLEDLGFSGVMPDLRSGKPWDIDACRRSLEQQEPAWAGLAEEAAAHFEKLDRILG